MNRRSVAQILDEVARDHMADNTDMTSRINGRIREGRGSTREPRVKLLAAAVLILLLLALLWVNVPGVAATIHRWFGYVPGFGFARSGEIRQLAAPVAAHRNGIVITVEGALLDSEKTVILYKVENVAPAASRADLIPPTCTALPSLNLPDGRALPQVQSAGIPQQGGMFEQRASFPAMPETEDTAILFFPCLQEVPVDQTPADWEIPLRFVSAPPGMTALPVFEYSAPTASVSTPSLEAAGDLDPSRISLSLDRVVPLDGGYLLYASMTWDNIGVDRVEVQDPASIHVMDAAGNAIPFDFVSDEMTVTQPEQRRTVFAIKTTSLDKPQPLTLTLDSVMVGCPVAASFTFDPGSDPRPGQVWDIDEVVDLGRGYSLRVFKASYPAPQVQDSPQQAGLSFDMESETGINGATLTDRAHRSGNRSATSSFPLGPFSAGFSYPGHFPVGPIIVDIQSILVRLPGNWQLRWIPPTIGQPVTATP